jgi:hypothetical protein
MQCENLELGGGEGFLVYACIRGESDFGQHATYNINHVEQTFLFQFFFSNLYFH